MRLLIVEDNAELADIVALRLADVRLASDRTASVEEAQLLIEAGDYGAMVLDLGLPDGDGIDLLRWLRGTGRDLPVLVMTARSAVADRVAGLRAGADDYLGKPFSSDELIARVEALLRRATGAGAAPWTCGRMTFDRHTRSVLIDGRALPLPPREAQLIDLLLRHRDRVVRRTQIEALFFGLGEDFSSNAIEVGVHRLRRRLDEADAGVEIVTVRGLGYLLRQRAAAK